ncbi:hypothetical protein METP3_02324 [Methanosarcinales archaeon]|nr:hypothetical protein METP3_02324 [Methanosarcinales archaeon]
MNNVNVCKECDGNRLLIYNEAARNGTRVEYRSVGLCTLCGSVVEL